MRNCFLIAMLGLGCGARSTLDEVSSSSTSSNQAGSNAGGSNAGGSNAGGSNAGGSNAGGSNAGGSNAGGSNAGGSNQGGSCAGFNFDIVGGVSDLSTDGKKVIASVSLEKDIGQIIAADLDDGTSTVLAETGPVYDVFVFGEHVYWAEALEDGSWDGHSIRRVPLGGGPSELVIETGPVAQLAVEADGIYFVEASLTEGPNRVMRAGPDGLQVLVVGLDFNWREMLLGAQGVVLSGPSFGVVDRDGGPFVELAPSLESRGLVEYDGYDYFLDTGSGEPGVTRVPILGGPSVRVLEDAGHGVDLAAYQDHYVLSTVAGSDVSTVWFGAFPMSEPPTFVAQAQTIGGSQGGAKVGFVTLTESFVVWSEFDYGTETTTIRTACRPDLP